MTTGNPNNQRHRLKSCRRRCPRESLTIAQAGYFREGTAVVECGTCQYSTPVLPVEEAISKWNESFGEGSNGSR